MDANDTTHLFLKTTTCLLLLVAKDFSGKKFDGEEEGEGGGGGGWSKCPQSHGKQFYKLISFTSL